MDSRLFLGCKIMVHLVSCRVWARFDLPQHSPVRAEWSSTASTRANSIKSIAFCS